MKYTKIFVSMFAIALLSYALSIFAMNELDRQQEEFFNMCAKGDINGVSDLIANGFNINMTNMYGWTPLHIACDHGHRNLVRYLVKHGADVNAIDGRGFTPIRIAFDKGYKDIANYLVAAEERSLSIAKKDLKQVVPVQSNKEARKEREKANQKKNTLNMQLAAFGTKSPVALEPEKHEKGIVIDKQSDLGCILDYSNRLGYYNEIYVYKNKGNSTAPGVYYRTPQGLKLVPVSFKSKDGLSMVVNQLGHLSFTEHVWGKMKDHLDVRHNFPQELEKEFGQWGRVVIENVIDNPNQLRDSQKKFKLIITIPGRINEMDYTTGQPVLFRKDEGAFEFAVKKSLYQEKGFCTHRFFAPKTIAPQKTLGGIIDEDGKEEKERGMRLAL